ncbi:ABC-2 type transporter-domain-containing protein [Lipomyces japonicus]|uniref:ABC-2 type transporter-domain-containing protein n=1 Tax=Lipomyces japonicus TaxID=56871 RepID=UPI0034CD7923
MASPNQLESQDDDVLESFNREQIHQIATHELERLESLSRVLSNRSAGQASDDLDAEDFKLEKVLRNANNANSRDGIKDRSIGVMFKSLTVVGVDVATTSLFTLGELLSAPFRIREAIKSVRNKKVRNLIEDFNGVVNKGEMLLVLGRPGAGCSTFLRSIAGEIDSFVSVNGEISYDGVDQFTMKRRFKGDVLFSAESDIHFPTLNVDQTLSFAIDTKAPVVRAGNISREQYIKDFRNILGTIFGLSHTFNTIVGNDYFRGVSGGERKRVSLAEVFAGRAKLISWDNSTRGLDASTALEYAHILRTTTNLLKNTALVAIYQAGENIYQLFDKVTVLYSGKQIYFGSIHKARAYFERMGYECQPRQTTAEFLTAVTDPAGRFVRSGFKGQVPQTAAQFEAYWKASDEYVEMLTEVEQYRKNFDPQALNNLHDSIDQERSSLFHTKNSPYALPFWKQVGILTRRGVQRQRGDPAYLIATFVSSVVQALIIGSLFYDMADTYNGSFSRGGVLFFSLLFFTLNAVAEMAMLYPQREIVQKHKRFAFYHPAAEALSFIFSTFPVKFVAMILFDLILYFISNLNRKPGQFFFFMLIVQFVTFAMTTFFQMISSFSPTIEIANAVAGLGVMIVFIYAGYLIPKALMHPWFGWLFYLNPIAYGFEALMSGEFHGTELDCTANLIPTGQSYENVSIINQVCAATGSRQGSHYVLGDNYLSDSFSFTWSHAWRNFGIIIGFAIFFIFMYMIGSEFTGLQGNNGDVLLYRRKDIPKHLDSDEVEIANSEASDEKDATFTDSDDGTDDSLKMKEVFSWQHLNYTVTLPNGEDRQLLCDIQGYTKPGTLTALMGESGAGKTTLLNNLAQRINVGVISGDMFVDGKPLNPGFKRRTGYVQQQDLHVPESTVRESLRFAALLRQPQSVPVQEKYDYVEKVIKMLSMEEYAEAVVGRLGQGLNVEQRKKLSIGVELASKPSLLLFLDEPTSGLDSQSAWAIVQLLKRLADAGQSILCTIHQPSATLFEQFDKLLLLKKGGKTVYFGNIGKNSSELINYFESNGAPQCGADENPAEYILNCIGAGATANTNYDWHDIWTSSKKFSYLSKEINDLHEELGILPSQEVSIKFSGTFAVNWFTQASAVTIRTYKQYWRAPDYIMAKFLLLISSGLFQGFSFWNSDFSLAGVQNLLFGVFLSIIVGVPNINQLQPRAIVFREIYEVRESPSNTYHWSCMMLGLFLAEVPYNVLFSTLFYFCYYWPINFNRSTEAAGYFFFVYCILYSLFLTSFGLAITTFSPDASTANIITAMLVSMILSFCGIFQPFRLIPHFWQFMNRISPLTYFMQGLLSNVLHDSKVTCKPAEFNILNPPSGLTCGQYMQDYLESNGGYINNPDATASCQYCKWRVADEYLETVNINYSRDRWTSVGYECVFIVFNIFFMFAGYYMFRVMNLGLVARFKKAIKRN